MGLLYGEFIFLLRFFGKKVYRLSPVFPHYGLEVNKSSGFELVKGLLIGFLFTFTLFTVEYLLEWLSFQPPTKNGLQLILEGLLLGLGVGFAEELLFRGWLLTELQKDYRSVVAIWVNAIIFAFLHFLKPIEEIMRTFPQFPGLVLLGLTLIWAKQSHKGRLAIAIGLHGGLVWAYYIVNAGQLVKYSEQIHPWIVGVNGNPLAGIMGLFFLVVLGVWMRGGRKLKV